MNQEAKSEIVRCRGSAIGALDGEQTCASVALRVPATAEESLTEILAKYDPLDEIEEDDFDDDDDYDYDDDDFDDDDGDDDF